MNDWTIRPNVGLGRLRFGTTPAEVDQLTETYGAVNSRRSLAPPVDVTESTIELLKHMLTEEQISSFREASEAQRTSLSGLVQEIRGHGLQLTYKNDRLDSLFAEWKTANINFEGHYLFTSNPIPAFLALQSANNAAPIVNDTDIYFANLHLGVYGFMDLNSNGRLVLREVENERGGERSIIWGVDYAPGEDITPKYRPVVIE
ncbi:MAG: hypothetical protein HC869_05335 [Rhodospirillales bacterium]|nr:hypothetical protein [Rhodospirillales bacterium]